jgi:hypothetical protein
VNIGEKVMSVIDEAGKFAKKAGKKIVEVATDVKDNTKLAIEKSKYKKQIANEKQSIQRDLTEIGRLFLTNAENNEVPEEYQPIIRSIKTSEKNIEMLTEKIHELDNIYVCGGCGNKLKRGQKFCQICGTKSEFAAENASEFDDSDIIDVEIKDEDVFVEVPKEDVIN